MTTLKQSQTFGARRLIAHLWQVYSGLAVRFGSLHRPQQEARPAQAAARAAAYDSQVLRHAVCANSLHEVDWLLYAAMMTGAAKRRYCLERALAINPGSEQAQLALARLAPHDGV
jgi:hypothetical protein